MRSTSIQLDDNEADGLRALVEATGESEEELLRRAAARGIRDLRLEQGIKAFKNGAGSGEAAMIAGMSRIDFLEILMDRGITMLDSEPSLHDTLQALACRFGDERLTEVARSIPPRKS